MCGLKIVEAGGLKLAEIERRDGGGAIGLSIGIAGKLLSTWCCVLSRYIDLGHWSPLNILLLIVLTLSCIPGV